MKITALLVMRHMGDSTDPLILANASDVSNFGHFQRSSVREVIAFVGRTIAKRTPAGRRQSVEHEGARLSTLPPRLAPGPRPAGTDGVPLRARQSPSSSAPQPGPVRPPARPGRPQVPPARHLPAPAAEYMVHCFNKGGLCGLAFVDRAYPMRSAFSVINKVSSGARRHCAAGCRPPPGRPAPLVSGSERPSHLGAAIQVLDEYEQVPGNSWQSAQADSKDAPPFLNDALVKYQDPTEADKLLKIQRDLDETKVILAVADRGWQPGRHLAVQHKTIDSVLARGEKLDTLVDKSTDLSMASQLFYKQAKKTNQCCRML
eukprot:SM001038S09167  [mRNA]  locus=s1038:51:1507:+ [translate_table: standard]